LINNRGEGDNVNNSLKPFAEFLSSMTKTAQGYYGNIENLFDLPKMEKQGANGKVNNPIMLHQLFFQISYLVAMGIWKSGFVLVFLSAIAMIIGLKIVLYVVNVMVHFFISPFIVIWAFATSPDGGAAKIKNYLRDTHALPDHHRHRGLYVYLCLRAVLQHLWLYHCYAHRRANQSSRKRGRC